MLLQEVHFSVKALVVHLCDEIHDEFVVLRRIVMGGYPVIVREVEQVPLAGLQFLALGQGFHVSLGLVGAQVLAVQGSLDVFIDLKLVEALHDAAALQRYDFRIIRRAAGGTGLAEIALAVPGLTRISRETVRLYADQREVIVTEGEECAVFPGGVAHPDFLDPVAVQVHILPLAERLPAVVFVRFFVHLLHRGEVLRRRGGRLLDLPGLIRPGPLVLFVGVAAAGGEGQHGEQQRREGKRKCFFHLVHIGFPIRSGMTFSSSEWSFQVRNDVFRSGMTFSDYFFNRRLASARKAASS